VTSLPLFACHKISLFLPLIVDLLSQGHKLCKSFSIIAICHSVQVPFPPPLTISRIHSFSLSLSVAVSVSLNCSNLHTQFNIHTCVSFVQLMLWVRRIHNNKTKLRITNLNPFLIEIQSHSCPYIYILCCIVCNADSAH